MSTSFYESITVGCESAGINPPTEHNFVEDIAGVAVFAVGASAPDFLHTAAALVNEEYSRDHQLSMPTIHLSKIDQHIDDYADQSRQVIGGIALLAAATLFRNPANKMCDRQTTHEAALAAAGQSLLIERIGTNDVAGLLARSVGMNIARHTLERSDTELYLSIAADKAANILQFEEPTHNAYVGIVTEQVESMPHIRLTSDSISKAIETMRWIPRSYDPDLDATVIVNGENRAYLIDLTDANADIADFRDDLARAGLLEKAERFIEHDIMKLIHGRGRQNKVDDIDATVFYKKNLGANVGLIRAYYAPLGSHDDGTPIFGTVALVRTKDHEFKVLKRFGVKGLNKVNLE